ncbi:hypothetical protein J0X15_15100 [Roseibium sp. CAU 1637]|uniref:Uncharacterized protein n=1 Tax=Roseibium limicola TaxID=2816037 RepID=A0A939EQA9_9HYPH|nr:hypothetical protein [Roseibium limicola]MBO0346558.1 hypothetical protein [Roseibium limicola]
MSASDVAMTLDDFSDALDEKGPDLSSWQPSEQIRAEVLLKTSPRARFLLSEAERLEMILKLAPRPTAPRGLVDRICRTVRAAEG